MDKGETVAEAVATVAPAKIKRSAIAEATAKREATKAKSAERIAGIRTRTRKAKAETPMLIALKAAWTDALLLVKSRSLFRGYAKVTSFVPVCGTSRVNFARMFISGTSGNLAKKLSA